MIEIVGSTILFLLGIEAVVAVGIFLFELIMEEKDEQDRKKGERKDAAD